MHARLWCVPPAYQSGLAVEDSASSHDQTTGSSTRVPYRPFFHCVCVCVCVCNSQHQNYFKYAYEDKTQTIQMEGFMSNNMMVLWQQVLYYSTNHPPNSTHRNMYDVVERVKVLSPPPHSQENFHNTMYNCIFILYTCIICMNVPLVQVFDETVACTIDTSL